MGVSETDVGNDKDFCPDGSRLHKFYLQIELPRMTDAQLQTIKNAPDVRTGLQTVFGNVGTRFYDCLPGVDAALAVGRQQPFVSSTTRLIRAFNEA